MKYVAVNTCMLRVKTTSIVWWCVFFSARNFARSKNRKVRRHLLQFWAFLLLLVCLCGHVAETFDFWDHTLQKGNDIEYSLVVVALVAGAVYGLAAIVMRTASPTSCLLPSLMVSSCCALSPVAGTGYSPSPPLRI